MEEGLSRAKRGRGVEGQVGSRVFNHAVELTRVDLSRVEANQTRVNKLLHHESSWSSDAL